MNNTSEYKRDSTGSFSLSPPLKITNQALIITFNVHERARFTVWIAWTHRDRKSLLKSLGS